MFKGYFWAQYTFYPKFNFCHHGHQKQLNPEIIQDAEEKVKIHYHCSLPNLSIKYLLMCILILAVQLFSPELWILTDIDKKVAQPLFLFVHSPIYSFLNIYSAYWVPTICEVSCRMNSNLKCGPSHLGQRGCSSYHHGMCYSTAITVEWNWNQCQTPHSS